MVPAPVTPPLPSLPELFLERLAQIVPADHLAACLDTFDQDKAVTFRVNTLVAEVEATRRSLRRAGFDLLPVAWHPAAFSVPPEQRQALAESDEFGDGRLYIQNASSLLAPLALDPEPGETVLDLAAAPGGKTLQIAMQMGNQGHLLAVEVVKKRFYRLRANLARGGASCAQAYLMDGRAAARRWPERFDRVLLDAPCSSEARFDRRRPASWRHWSLRKIREMAHKQKGLLRAAIDALKPGGRLIYCTCSLAPEENEQVIAHVLKRQGGQVQVEPLALPVAGLPGLTEWAGRALPPELTYAVRILPDDRHEAAFLCRLTKSTST